jgi:hypothetical protein
MIRELKVESDVIATLEQAIETAKETEMESCLLVMLPKQSGGPHLSTNRCSGYQRAFMVSFIQAWIAKWHFEERN